MKGQAKNRITNIKQFFNRAINKLISKGNKEYKEKEAAVKSKFMDYIPPAKPKQKKVQHPTRFRKSHPGYKRKFGNKPMAVTKPNPAKAGRKTVSGPSKHLLHPRGLFDPAPTQDQVRRLEKRIGLKVRVKLGECYVGNSQFKLPVNATLEEAQKALDAFIEAKAA